LTIGCRNPQTESAPKCLRIDVEVDPHT
jgi:hypothetical protein